MIKYAIMVGVGGFAGSALRFIISRWMLLHATGNFPWGTFAVNILGSLILGLLVGLSEKSNSLSTEWLLLLSVGFCGGFTTFSTFSLESLQLLEGKQWIPFFAYTLFSFVLGLAAIFLGRAIVNP